MVARISDRTDSSAGNGKSFKYVETLGDSVVRGGVNTKAAILKKAAGKVREEKTGKTPYILRASRILDTASGSVMTAGRDGKYTVQLTPFPDLEMAKEIEETLKSRTYPAYIEKVNLP
jgi:cell division septation protein DedD